MEYKLEHTSTAITIADYVVRYRDTDKFIKFCKECDRYNACWACPPYDFDIESCITPYTNAFIIGTKITPNENLQNRCDSNEKPYGEQTNKEQSDNGQSSSEQFNKKQFDNKKSKEIAQQLITDVRKLLDEALLLLEQRYPNSRALFAGTCHLCTIGMCARIKGEPCIHPDKIRPSLEAFGFDIGKTASELLGVELKWSTYGELPEYFVLVSGFFTNHSEIEIPLENHICDSGGIN
jgi:Predicted metal-binding protein